MNLEKRYIFILLSLISFILIAILILMFNASWHTASIQKAEIVFYLPEYKGKATMTYQPWLKNLQEYYEQAEYITGAYEDKDIFWKIDLEYDDGIEKVLVATRQMEIYDLSKLAWIANEKIPEVMVGLVKPLEESFFGETIDWNKVDQLFPRKTQAQVRDVETGQIFNIFRYGGTNHVDVEPLTEADTQILKGIYGEWGWKRRAVIVTVGGKQIAASMNGMPHGNGQIAENKFNGHFCIHFTNSRVHKTGRVDEGHQLMISKSAGNLLSKLDNASPVEKIGAFLIAVANNELMTVRHLTNNIYSEDIWNRLKSEIRFISLGEINEITTTDNNIQVRVQATVYFFTPNRDIGYDKELIFNLNEDIRGDYLVNFSDVVPLLARNSDEEKEAIALDKFFCDE
ncbi:MAG: hypothetical protein SCK28_11640 [Bacillota bacterium]|nr:hypothetical protein [Bacillota bacterium]